MFCTKCGAKLSDQAKFCTSCGEPIRDPARGKNYAEYGNKSKNQPNKAPINQSKKKNTIITALIVVVILLIIIAACGDTTDSVGDDSTERTLQSEEIIVSDTPTVAEPDTEPTPAETEETTNGSKYPKSYNEKGELIVYWLDSGSVWHESINCGTVAKADPSKLHSGTPNEAYSSGKERACKTCSSDSTVEIVETTRISETTRTPDTARVPETTKTPETSRVPETTQEVAPDEPKYPKSYDKNGELIVYWFNNGAVWHESKECSVIKVSFFLKPNEGSASEAYSNGKTHACTICSSDSTVIIPDTTSIPETTRVPETTKTPETTSVPETTKTPETTKNPESTSNPEDARTVYWVTEGYVWHYSKDCWTLDDSVFIYSGYATDAKAIGKERACKVCADGSTIETPETTIEPEITIAPEETASPSTDEGITIVSWPITASRNEVVSVKILGKPNTKYQIEVNYKSGPSTSDDLAPQISNSDGEVTWTWKVGARSTAGTFDIIVKDYEGNSVKVEWTVVVD